MTEIYVEDEQIKNKYNKLKLIIKELGRVAIAFSGGVDSTFLMKCAHEVLGDAAFGITILSGVIPDRELTEAKAFCEKEKIQHYICTVNEMDIKGFCENPPDRCYICKKSLFEKMKAVAIKNGASYLAEGSNVDDMGDYRPGMRAVKELEVRSPLKEAGLSKEEIRYLSKCMELPTWSKPSFACLASRIPYGEEITGEKLARIDKAEQLLLDMGFQQFRVRLQGKTARIEVLPQDFEKIMRIQNREKIVDYFKKIGFSYTSLDLSGYRTGSLNEVLNNKE